MRWFKNAKMSVNLLTSFVAVAGLTAIMGTMVVRGRLSADDRDTMLYEQAARPLGAVADLARDYQRVRGNRRDVIMMEGQFDKYNGKLGGATKDVQTDLARLDSSAATKEAKDGIAGVRAELATLAPIMAGIDHLAETRQYGEAKRQYAADA